MKRKIAVLLAVLLAVPYSMASCGDKCEKHQDEDRDEVCDFCGETVTYEHKYLGFEGIYNPNYEPTEEAKIAYAKAKNIAALENLNYWYSEGNLISFKNDEVAAGATKYAVLNTETGDVVFSLKKEASDAIVISEASLEWCAGEVFILVEEKDYSHTGMIKYTEELYTSAGKTIVAKNAVSYENSYDDGYDYEDNEDGRLIHIEHIQGETYVIDGKIYEIKDGVAIYQKDQDFSRMPAVDYSTETNHYDIQATRVLVYDLDYKVVAEYSAPAGVELNAFLLADGNVFIQTLRALPEDAEQYDLYMDGVKYALKSMIFNITEKKTTAVETDYVIEEILNVYSSEEFMEIAAEGAVTNVALFYDVVSKTVDYNRPLFGDFDNQMTLRGFLAEEIAAQESIALPIGSGRYVVSDLSGREFLLNEKGEVIGEVTNASYDYTLKLFRLGEKYYDLDLKLVYDGSAAGNMYMYVDGNDDFSIYCKEKGDSMVYYIQTGTAIEKLNLPDNVTNIEVNDGENYFTYTYSVKDDKAGDGESAVKEYMTYCNRLGKTIYSVEITSNSYAGIYVQETGDILIFTLYIRAQKQDTTGGEGNGDISTETEIKTKIYIAK